MDMGQIDPNNPPNFSRSYPLAGEMIGPAWRAAWRALCAEPGWLRMRFLVGQMCRASGVQDKTARNLLAGARKAGLLVVRYDGPHGEARYKIK